jgi:transcriptional regulator with XRE-family HTH domain
MFFGKQLRLLREKKGLVLRQVAAAIEVDTATVSKIERGDRQAKEEQLPLLANILDANLNELKTLWLAEKVYQIVKEEDNAIEVLNTVIEYNKTNA